MPDQRLCPSCQLSLCSCRVPAASEQLLSSLAGWGSKLLYSVILTPSGQSRPRISCHRSAQTPDTVLSPAQMSHNAETKHVQCHKFVSNIFMGLFRGRSIFQVFLLLIIVSGQSGGQRLSRPRAGWPEDTELWLHLPHCTHCEERRGLPPLITGPDIIQCL